MLACFIRRTSIAHTHTHTLTNNISVELRDNNTSEDELSPDSTALHVGPALVEVDGI